jgi:hypothetical protein
MVEPVDDGVDPYEGLAGLGCSRTRAPKSRRRSKKSLPRVDNRGLTGSPVRELTMLREWVGDGGGTKKAGAYQGATIWLLGCVVERRILLRTQKAYGLGGIKSRWYLTMER